MLRQSCSTTNKKAFPFFLPLIKLRPQKLQNEGKMQATTPKTLTIGLLYERSDVGDQFIRSLTNTFGEGKDIPDQRRYLYTQFSKVIDNVQVNINAMVNTERGIYISSLYPVTGQDPDLIFLFNSCVGVNNILRKGDLVINDQSNETLKRRFKENEAAILQSLPEIKLGEKGIDLDEAFVQVICLLHAGPKKGKDIKEALKINGEQTRLIIDKVLMPHNGKLWSSNPTTYQWELTALGEEEYKKQSTKYFSTGARTSYACIGSSDNAPGWIKSTTDLKVDVIEQLSKVAFEGQRPTVQKIKTMQVSVVKCLVNGDIEDPSPYAASMGESLVAFMLKMVELCIKS